jgi:flavin-binding protein dodecin
MYQQNRRKRIVAKQAGAANSVYKVVEIVGTSTQSWEDAAKNAVETAGGTLRDLRIAEVAKMDLTVKDGKVLAYLPAIFSLLVFDKK